MIKGTPGRSIRQFLSNHNHLPSFLPTRQSAGRFSLRVYSTVDILIVIHMLISQSTITAKKLGWVAYCNADGILSDHLKNSILCQQDDVSIRICDTGTFWEDSWQILFALQPSSSSLMVLMCDCV